MVWSWAHALLMGACLLTGSLLAQVPALAVPALLARRQRSAAS